MFKHFIHLFWKLLKAERGRLSLQVCRYLKGLLSTTVWSLPVSCHWRTLELTWGGFGSRIDFRPRLLSRIVNNITKSRRGTRGETFNSFFNPFRFSSLHEFQSRGVEDEQRQHSFFHDSGAGEVCGLKKNWWGWVTLSLSKGLEGVRGGYRFYSTTPTSRYKADLELS